MILSVCLLTFSSCMEDDMMFPKTQANITEFAVEGQVSATFYSSTRKIVVLFPHGTDVSAVQITSFGITEGATIKSGALAAGQTIDLTDTVKVTLSIYQDYEWKIYATFKEDGSSTDPSDEPQLYNSSFDNWTMDGKTWCLYGTGASDKEISTWGTANKGTSDILSYNTTVPEESFLAVSGSGKKAAKLTSKYSLIKFASGNLFNGQFVKISIMPVGAELAWGFPFTAKPVSLSGYYCYQGVAIDHTDSDHASLKGEPDLGQIQILLTDWDEQFHVISHKSQFVDIEGDEHIIAYGSIQPTGTSTEYTHFTIPIKYRNDRTPKWIVIVCASSYYGDYFTGGDGSVLYLDEFSLGY